MLKQGQGHKAIKLTTYGSLLAIFTLILISFPATMIMEKIYEVLTKKYVLPLFLIGVSSLLIIFEKKKLSAFLVFLITGFLGLIVLNLEFLNQPLLPLLTGLFGGSMLVTSIKNKTEIPEQKISSSIKNIKVPVAKAFLGSLIASPLCSFLPGLGSGQAAIIGNTIARSDKEGFLILLGATNTLVMGFSFISLYAISKTRTGAAVAIQELIGTLTTPTLILILVVAVISGIISFFVANFLSKIFVKKISKIDYSAISYVTLVILTIIVFLVSDFLGIFVLIISTLTGIYCISMNVRRTNMMGCLLIPTIVLYLI
jgi:putative membrane protein